MSKYDAFFVSAEIHKRTVTLGDGSEHELHFRELPVSMYRKFQIAETSSDEDVRAGSMAKLIAASLCEADGSPAMTYEQACNLKPNISSRLFNEVIALGGAGEMGKGSPPGEKSGSSTSSLSPSAAEPSPNGETPSLEKSSTAGESSTESSPSTTTTGSTDPQP